MNQNTVSKDKQCLHCSAPFDGTGEFCCHGCDYVYHLIRDQGLEHYYDLKDKQLPPVGSTAFLQRDDSELVEDWKQSIPSGTGVFLHKRYALKGVSCIGCVWLIEKLFSRHAGASRILIDPQLGKLEIEADPNFDLAEFAAEIQRFGYTLKKWSGGSEFRESSLAASKIGICAFLAMNTMGFTLPFYLGMEQDNQFAPLLRFAAVVLASFSVLFGGTFFFARAWRALQVGSLHIDLPIALGISVAYVGSLIGWMSGDKDLFYFDFVAVFIVLMLVGRWLQERITERNVQMAHEANPLQHDVLMLEGRDVSAATLPVENLGSGMRYLVRTGSWVPVQSRVVGETILAELQSISGESEPRLYEEGQVIPSGAGILSRNGARLEAIESWSDSLMKRLIEVQSRSESSKDIMQKVLRVYISVVLAVAFLGLLYWGIFPGYWLTAIQVAVSVLVVSCPCAIGLAYPMANEQCTRWLKGRGVYLRTLSLWGRLPRVRRVFFDKTGTLTLETLSLMNPETLDTLDSSEVLALYGLVDQNRHPVGRSLKTVLLVKFPSLSRNQARLPLPEEQVAFGVSYCLDGVDYSLGKSQSEESTGLTEFKVDGVVRASFQFEESVRHDARQSVEALERMGMEVSIISGDSDAKVRAMTGWLGLPKERGMGHMSPADKARWIEQSGETDSMMIGDGANDALAFEKALCRATPVIGRGLLEHHSDFFFMGQGIRGVLDVFRLASIRLGAVRELMTFTITYNLTVVIIALLGWMNPLIAAVVMPVSSIVAVSWATFRLRQKRLDGLMR